jgi:hypothetical protein
MREFNLEMALAGQKIIDEKGNIGEYKLTNTHNGIKTHLFQFTVNNKKDQAICSYKEGVGWFYGFGKCAEVCDELMWMAPVKKQEWLNIYKDDDSIVGYTIDGPFNSEESAKKIIDNDYVTTVLIREWEE